jgi:hypothetical protein
MLLTHRTWGGGRGDVRASWLAVFLTHRTTPAFGDIYPLLS